MKSVQSVIPKVMYVYTVPTYVRHSNMIRTFSCGEEMPRTKKAGEVVGCVVSHSI